MNASETAINNRDNPWERVVWMEKVFLSGFHERVERGNGRASGRTNTSRYLLLNPIGNRLRIMAPSGEANVAVYRLASVYSPPLDSITQF